MSLSRSTVPLSRSDAGRAAVVLARAFHDDPLMVHIQPDPVRRALLLPRGLRGVQGYCLRYGQVVTTPDVASVACWLPPGEIDTTTVRMARSGMLASKLWLGVAGLRRMLGVLLAMDRGHRRVMTGPHWYLWLLGTEPARQGQGVASAVLAPTLAAADAAGLPCYLDTHRERNLGFYARHGFVPVLDEVYSGVRSWGLRRDPS